MKKVTALLMFLQLFCVASVLAVTPQPSEVQMILPNLIPGYAGPLYQPNNYASILRKIVIWSVSAVNTGAYVVSGQTTNLTVTLGTTGTASDGTWVNLTTTATTASVASIGPATVNATEIQVGPISYFQIQPSGSLSGIRYWVGLFSAAPQGSDTLGTIQGAALRFSDGAGDTVWQEVTSNGTTQTTTANTASIAPVAGTTEIVVVDCSVAGQATFYINGQKLDTISTNLPAGATAMVPIVTVTNTASAIKVIKTGTVILSSN